MTARNDGRRLLPVGLVVLTGLIFSGCQPGPGTPMEQPDQGPSIDPNAGIEWRLARRGGGFASPGGSTGQNLRGVAWNGTRFVAVGRAGTIVHSSDGDTWTEASGNTITQSLFGVASGGGRFVAVGDLGTIVHSSDGDSWSAASDTATTELLYGVTWNGTICGCRSVWNDRAQQRRG